MNTRGRSGLRKGTAPESVLLIESGDVKYYFSSVITDEPHDNMITLVKAFALSVPQFLHLWHQHIIMPHSPVHCISVAMLKTNIL